MKSTGYNSWTSVRAVVSCFIIRLLITLPMRLTSLIFVIIISAYDTDRKSATYPIVTFGVVRTLTGPLIGYFGKTFGIRPMILIGGVLSSIGIGSCFFAKDIIAVTICLGFIYGLGLAFGSTLMFTIVKRHFTKNLNTMNGFVLTGSTMGAVIMPPVIQYLFELYGASGMFLILGALTFNIIPSAILLGDPKNKERLEIVQARRAQQKETMSVSDYMRTVDSLDNLILDNVSADMISIDTEKVSYKYKDNESGDEGIDLNFEPTVPVFYLEIKEKNSNDHLSVSNSNEMKLSSYDVNNINSWNDMPCELNFRKTDLEPSSAIMIPKLSRKDKKKLARRAFNLFKDLSYILMMFIQSAHAFITTLNWTILVDYANDKSIPLYQGIYIVMLLPVAETLGNLCLNWIIDRRYLSKPVFCCTCFLIMGTCSICLIWTYDFRTMLSTYFIFAFFAGAVNTAFPGLIFDFVEEEQQSLALASRFMLYGFLCLLKSPIIGYFRGTLGSYDYVYYIIGGVCIMCGALTNFTPLLSSRKRIKKARKHLQKSMLNFSS